MNHFLFLHPDYSGFSSGMSNTNLTFRHSESKFFSIFNATLHTFKVFGPRFTADRGNSMNHFIFLRSDYCDYSTGLSNTNLTFRLFPLSTCHT